MDEISSINNQRVKNWKKLLTRKGRKKANKFLIEGYHLIEEALNSNYTVIEIMSKNKNDLEAIKLDKEIERVYISEEIVDEISDTETTQGIFAIIETENREKEITFDSPFLLLDSVQDPGNLGTLIRTADAAGFNALILGEGTVDAYNPKTLRSAQGSHFHIPLIEGELKSWVSNFKEKNISVYGTALTRSSISYKKIEPSSAFALIVGNEGNGVSKEILDMTDQNLHIPMRGKAESLNVAIAAGILMFTLYD